MNLSNGNDPIAADFKSLVEQMSATEKADFEKFVMKANK